MASPRRMASRADGCGAADGSAHLVSALVAAGRNGRRAGERSRVTTLDWIALAVIAVAALNGLRRGLVVGAFALAGIVAGAYAGAKLAPELLSGESAYTPLVALAGAVVVGSLLRMAGRGWRGSLVAARAAAPARARHARRTRARRRDRPRARLGCRSGSSARSRPERPAQGGAALADPARDQPASAALAAPRCDRPGRPPRPDAGPQARVPRPTPRYSAIPASGARGPACCE